MSRRTCPVHRSALLALASLFVALSAGFAPSAASAAQTLQTIDLPSEKGYVKPEQITFNKGASKLQANVVLPDGYEADPAKRWPVLFLLPGIGDTALSWANPKKGNILETAKDFPGIIVMPEAARGYFTDWWRGGQRNSPQWERYYLEEVIPTIDARYRVAEGRQNHAIGGISMGAYGGMLLAGQLPGYFGSILSLSGLYDLQSSEIVNVLPSDIGSPFAKIWGAPGGPYARAHNPLKNISNIATNRMYVSTGNGTPRFGRESTIGAYFGGAISEYAVWRQSLKFAARARVEGVDLQYSGYKGVHDWPYWRRELPKAIKWGLFGTPKVTDSGNTRWTYKTMAPRGNAWGIGYSFAAKTFELATFRRDGQQLSATGAGTVTINPGAAVSDATGAGTKPECSFTAKLPFEHTLPAGC